MELSAAGAPKPQVEQVPAGYKRIDYPMYVEDAFVKTNEKGEQVLSPDLTAKLLQPGQFVTTQQEVQDLIVKVKQQAAPDGTYPELVDSKATTFLKGAQNTGLMVGQMAGGIGTLNLIHPTATSTFWHVPSLAIPHTTITTPSFALVPTHIAMHAATLMSMGGGVCGIVMGTKMSMDSFNKANQFKKLKAAGQTEVETVQVVPGKGKQIVVQPVDAAISGERDKAIGGLLIAGTGVAMIAAAIGAGGPFGVLAAGLMWKIGIGASLIQQRQQLTMLAKVAAYGINHMVDRAVARVKSTLFGIEEPKPDPMETVTQNFGQALGNLNDDQKKDIKQIEEMIKQGAAATNVADPTVAFVAKVREHCASIGGPIEQEMAAKVAPSLNPKDETTGKDKTPEQMQAELQAVVEHKLLENDAYQRILHVYNAATAYLETFQQLIQQGQLENAQNVMPQHPEGPAPTTSVAIPADASPQMKEALQQFNAVLASQSEERKWSIHILEQAAKKINADTNQKLPDQPGLPNEAVVVVYSVVREASGLADQIGAQVAPEVVQQDPEWGKKTPGEQQKAILARCAEKYPEFKHVVDVAEAGAKVLALLPQVQNQPAAQEMLAHSTQPAAT